MISSLLLLSLLSCVFSSDVKSPNCSNIARLQTENGTTTGPPPAKGDKFVDFDWQIVKEVNADGDGNMIISPISLKVVLAMLFEGARGKTAEEIGDALDLANTTDAKRMSTRRRFSTILKSLQTSEGKYEIKMGTHVFIDKTAEPKEMYQCKLQHYYNSDMQKVDFSDPKSAAREINKWASNATHGHIQDLIDEADDHSSTIMLLLNAVYFKGLWEIPFPENQTGSGVFHLNEKQSVHVPMMNTTDKFAYCNMSDVDAQLLRLPYLGGKFAMYILLPNKKTGLSALTKTLGPNKPLTGYLQNLTMLDVNLVMPKFEFDYTISLRPSLERLNLTSMFSESAELSDIAKTKSGGLVVTNVLQKAGISVTEIGTVAYVATTVELMDKFGGDEETLEFKVDRPFLFFIQDESVKTTVFVGKITNPENTKVIKESSPSSDQPTPATTPSSGKPVKPTQCSGSMCTSEEENRFGNNPDPVQTARFNFFDASLLKEMAIKESGNFVISPASVKTLLALILEGAEGTTLEQILQLMLLPMNITESRQILSALPRALEKTTNSKVTVDSVAQAFVSKSVTPNATYVNAIKENYMAGITQQDFSFPNIAANNINSWVSTRTRGMIDSLMDPDFISPETFAILVSAVYFEGKWKTEFLTNDTKPMCFFPEPRIGQSHQDPCQKVQTMFKIEELMYKFDEELESHVVQIPYQDERFSMVIVLPRSKDGMKTLSLYADNLKFPRLLKNMILHEVFLNLPRFNAEYGTSLIPTLEKMNLRELFSEKAQLPYMINNKKARISAIVHKTKIEVNEQGTKAASASGAGLVPLMFGPETVHVNVDHPFFYFIYDQESQALLFSGRISTMEGTGEMVDDKHLDKVEPLRPSNKPSIEQVENYHYNNPPTTTGRYKYPKEPIHFPSAATRNTYNMG